MVTSHLVAATDRAVSDQHHLTLGVVEEEFLLLDPDTGSNVLVADEVLAALPTAVRRQSRLELRRSMVYWYARPSASYPTVEVRVGDACPSADDTVLVAALIRALVATMIDDERAGAPVEDVRDCVLSAAHWHAAREGLGGTLVDLRLGAVLRPAWDVVDELVATVSPALLRHGDIELVVTHLARLRSHGTGATRQRRVHARTADINAVLADLARQTIEQ